jgi:hypothetical protein
MGWPDSWSVTLPRIVPANRAPAAPMTVLWVSAGSARVGGDPNASGSKTAGNSVKCMVFLLTVGENSIHRMPGAKIGRFRDARLKRRED